MKKRVKIKIKFGNLLVKILSIGELIFKEVDGEYLGL
jgi:hypothetical protein